MSAEPHDHVLTSARAGLLRTVSAPWNYVRRSVRGKLIAGVFLTTLVVLLIAGTSLLVHDLSVYRKSWAADVAAEASVLAVATAPALAFNDREAAERHMEALGARPSIMAAALYDASGERYAAFVRGGEDLPQTRPLLHLDAVRVSGQRVEVTERVGLNDETLGTLYVRARYDVTSRIKAYLGIFSLISVLSLGSAFMLSAALQRWLTVPLEDIGRVSRQIVHGSDFSLRVRQTTNDEIGLAVQALNRMLDEVQARAEALEHSNASLRQQVEVRQKAEAALARANERLESTMGAAEIGGWVLDLRTDELGVDRNFAALFGVDGVEPFASDPELRWRGIHAEDVPAVREAEMQARRSGVFSSTEFRIVQPDGSVRWVIGRGRVQTDANGKPTRLAGLLIDITAQKHAEQQRRETEKLYRAIGESIDFGVWITDAEGRCIYASDSFLRLIGMTQEQCSNLGWTSMLHPDEVAATVAAWTRCVRLGENWYREHRVLGADGAYHPVLAQGVAIRDEEGAIRGWAGINLDISPLKRTEQALREADRRKDEFLATLAHELRNPLAPIRHATRLLESPRADDAQRRWGREVIARQVEHMAMLLDDLLDVSRITRGRLELRRDYVSLEKIVASAVETARPLIDARRHALEVDLGNEPVDLMVDPLRLAQALSNLLMNAAKYTDPGGTISLAARRESGGVTISVTDTGIGLHEGSLAKVFEMFSQVEGALERSQGGLGIGLALVKGLVQLHGGTVEASSPGPGQGSTFTVRLPGPCVVGDLLAGATKRLPTISSPTSGPRRRVLVADDNRDAAQALSTLLRIGGHEVFTVNSGSEALDVAARERPEACILDIGMPGLSGYEVARRIRQADWGKDVLLVALTGWGQGQDVARAKAAGFDRHCTKPVDVTEIEGELRRFGAAKA
ncbi:MAG: hybrid sensor histidine kinase/response regulator [Steroidobacteraceae bacterium]|nr:hybrid sensor histidine kinase/response regulator [Steroidobacteraceae bacterium]